MHHVFSKAGNISDQATGDSLKHVQVTTIEMPAYFFRLEPLSISWATRFSTGVLIWVSNLAMGAVWFQVAVHHTWWTAKIKCGFQMLKTGETAKYHLRKIIAFIRFPSLVYQGLKQLGASQIQFMDKRTEFETVLHRHTSPTFYETCLGFRRFNNRSLIVWFHQRQYRGD